MSRGQSMQPRRTTLGRCTNKGNTNEEVIVDVDEENIDVVVVDAPETSHQGGRYPRTMKGKDYLNGVINIDDEEDGDDTPGIVHGIPASPKLCRVSVSSPMAGESDDDECLMFVRKGKSPRKGYHNMRPFSGGAPKNIFGLGLDSGTSSCESDNFQFDISESDSSDCEIVEDSSGSIREQWERAASKKRVLRRHQNGSEDWVSASGSSADPGFPSPATSQNNVDGESSSISSSEIPDGIRDFARNDVFQEKEEEVIKDKEYSGYTTCQQYCDENDTAGFQEKENLDLEDLARHTCQLHVENGTSENAGNKELPIPQNDLIGERERHKESDEYRRAVEEEWAARQRELQLQAEEVQRLRKRRKAESLRLLEMEKRQKQRIEEIRETQKKDEETINLKEQLRVEVRKELDKMEMTYRDMASLLRALGINIEGGLSPLSREVNVAYKQALLRFHPDRASRTDIRQQVEAEEKFKLISRLKDRLLPVA